MVVYHMTMTNIPIIIFILVLLQLHWHGDRYFTRGPKGNDIHKTNVPNIRIKFRHEASSTISHKNHKMQEAV